MNDDINNSLSQQDGLFGRAEPQFNVSKWLMQQAEPEEEPVSLDNLKQDEIDKIMTAVKNGREIAKTYYEGTVEPELIKRQKLRRADKSLYKKKFPNLTEYSKFVSMDFNNTVEWIKPSLVEVFIGTESPVTIAGANIQNDDTATKMQQLVEYQLTRKNSYTSMVHDVIDDALSVNIGVCKAWWKREEKRDRYKMMFNVNDMQTAMMLTQASMSGEIEIQSIKPLKDTDDLYEVQFDRVQVTANYPVIEYVPPSELRYTPEGSNLQECKFVAHRKIVKGDYLKRKEQEGVYQHVDEALEHVGDANYTDDDIYHNETLNKGKMKTDDGDDASKDVELYECYVDVDYNNDGIYEHLIVHCVGDTALSIQTNEFNIAPFFSIPGIRDSRKIFSDRSLAEEIEGLQDIKTALVKQLIINVAKTNDQQKFIDYQKIVDPDAMLSGDEYVACQGDPNAAIYMPPQAPVSPLTMDLINYAETEIQNRSGSTKYNQGLDADSLNKTARGITAIMGAADKRIKLMARLIAENWTIPMVRFIILLNKKYGEPIQTFRYKDTEVSINNDDLDIDYDFVINVGNGAGTKEARIQSYMLLLSNVYPILAQVGVATPKSYYAAGTALLEEMGLKNTQEILLDPDSEEAKAQQAQQAQQTQQQAMAMQQAQQQAQMALKQADIQGKIAVKATPSISADIKDLPVDAQTEIINKATAGNTNQQDVAMKEVLNNVR